MPWLILPPQPDGEENIRAFLGRSTGWPTPEALRVFTSASARGRAIPPDKLPPTRNPDLALGTIVLPEALLMARFSAAGPVTNFDPLEDVPDVVFGAGYSWFVKAKVKDLLEQVAPGAIRFEPVNFDGPHGSEVQGTWFLLVFLQYADVIDEERSALLPIFETRGNWNRPGPLRDAKLFAPRSAVEGYDFWTGVSNTRQPPLNAANVAFTYCSDAVMDAIRAAGITGFGPAYEIDLIEDDDESTVAPGSPRQVAAAAREVTPGYHLLQFNAKHFGGAKSKDPRFETDDPTTSPLWIPSDQTFPDIWLLDARLIASERAKTILEDCVSDDVGFSRVVPVELEDGSLYSGAPLFQLTRVENMQPFVSEMSGSLEFSILSSGSPSMSFSLQSIVDLVVDVAALGACRFWDAGSDGYRPFLFAATEVFDALVAGGVTGVESRPYVRAVDVG